MHEVQSSPIRPASYEAPKTLDRALALLDQHGSAARVIAGGTDLMIELDRRLGGDVAVLIDITRIPGLGAITSDESAVSLGPLVTHNQCATSELVISEGLALAQASLEVGSPALRNRATVVGNVVTASPANDTISALRVLEADLILTSATGTRRVALADFHTGVRKTVLEPNELVTAISFPISSGDVRSLFVKLGLRRAQAISVVHLAVLCTLDDQGIVSEARIALGSVAPTIVRATDAERLLIGGSLNASAIEAAARSVTASVHPIDDVRATASYRTELLQVMVGRALRTIAADEHRDMHPLHAPTLGGPSVPADGKGFSANRGDILRTEINGSIIEGSWTPTSLLDWIREQAQLTGTKEGCAEGECGACTIHVDGVATLSCLVPAGRAEGTSITTIEGLADGHQLHPLQQAFIESAAVQCGYCIPGFLMAGACLQADNDEPSAADLKAGLSGNLCRCTGYYNIENAFQTGPTT